MRVAYVSFFLFVWTLGCLGGRDHAIHTAAIRGQLDEVKRFVEEKKVDVNIRNQNGRTPLIEAARTPTLDPLVQQRLEVVKYLIEKGADVNAVDNDGFGALLLATWDSEPENLSIVKYLVEKGANVNAESKTKMRPLHKAATFAQLEMVKYLIEKGADVNAKDKFNDSPLLSAAYGNVQNYNSSLDTVKYLVEKGAVVLTDESHRLIRYSILNHNLDMLKYFINLGVPVTGSDSDKETPLHTAALTYKDTLEPIKILLKKGADASAVDKKGRTPAHYAAERGHWQVLEYLGDNTNANLYAEDNDKRTPYSIVRTENWNSYCQDYLESWARKQKKQSQKTA